MPDRLEEQASLRRASDAYAISGARTPGVIAVVGEAVMDLVPGDRPELFEAAPGGSPANVAVGLARLKVPARFGARLGADPLGRRLRAHLAGNGVDLSYAVRAAEPSSLAIVSVDPDGTPAYDFRIAGTADWQWQDKELVGLVDEQVIALHTGSLASILPPGADAVQRLLEWARDRVTISYDPNLRPLLMGSRESVARRVDELVALADVVKVSAEDVAWLASGRSPAEVATAWQARGPAIVAVTLGPEGAVAASRDAGVVRCPGRQVDVVDTVGAGDSFTAALLAGLHRRNLLGPAQRAVLQAIDARSLAVVLEEAVLASALTCARHGAVPPTLDELRVSLQRKESFSKLGSG